MKFKLLKTLLPLSLLFLFYSAYGAGTKIGDLYYNLDFNTKTASVTYSTRLSPNSIGEKNYPGLTKISIPATFEYNGTSFIVTSIGSGAFRYCSSLTSVTIPNSVTSIGDEAFCYCSGLTSVSIPNSITSIPRDAFYECSSLKSVTIPNSVTSIGSLAFMGCRALTSVTISNSISSIGFSAFEGCSGLTSFNFPKSLTWIGDRAFRYCSSLRTIYFNSEQLLKLGTLAFDACNSIEYIYCNTGLPPRTNYYDVFSSGIFKSAIVYVPTKDLSLYKSNDPWKDFSNIVGLDQFPVVDAVEQIQLDTEERYTIFNLNGVCVKSNATKEDVDGLAPGIYIINGKKVVKSAHK